MFVSYNDFIVVQGGRHNTKKHYTWKFFFGIQQILKYYKNTKTSFEKLYTNTMFYLPTVNKAKKKLN